MYKIYLYSVGKSKESWLNEALDLYQKRLSHKVSLHFKWAKNSKQLLKWLEGEHKIVCLDEKGQTYSSVQFSNFLFDTLQKYGCELHLVIGDAFGLPEELQSFPKISLSKMTFTHQMVRLILIEQIYRAWAIQEGSPYHLS